jgi:hypothetical protein
MLLLVALQGGGTQVDDTIDPGRRIGLSAFWSGWRGKSRISRRLLAARRRPWRRLVRRLRSWAIVAAAGVAGAILLIMLLQQVAGLINALG